MKRYRLEGGSDPAAPLINFSRRRGRLTPFLLGGALAVAAGIITLGCRSGVFASDVAAATPAAPVSSVSSESAPGVLRASAPTFRVMLSSLDGIETVKGTNGRAEVPPGSYTVMRWSAEATDAAGRRWEAKGGMMPKPLEVRSGQETRLHLGDPIRVIMRGFYAMNPVSFRLEYAGSQGELFEGVWVDGRPATPPLLQVRDEKGKLVANQRFKAGCKGTCLLSWKTPPGMKGRFIASAVPDFGPFRTVLVSPLEFTLNGKQAAAVPPWVGGVAPDFRLLTTAQGSVQLSLQRGEPVVLAFFCRCGLCINVAKEIATTPGITGRAKVLAVFADQAIAEPGEEKAFRDATGFQAPFLLDLSVEVGTLYDSAHCPRVWVIDPKGIVRYRSLSQTTPPAQIVAEVLKALG